MGTAPVSTPVLDAAEGCGAIRLRARGAVRRAVPADSVPRRPWRCRLPALTCRWSAPSSIDTATCSPARSEWSCRSSRHSMSASRPTSRWCRRQQRRVDGIGAGRASGRPRAHRRGDGQQQSKRGGCGDGVTAPARRLAGDAAIGSGEVRARERRRDGQVQRDASGHGQAGRLRRRCGGCRRARGVLHQGYEVVEYPHIHRRHVVEPAQTRVKVIDVRIAPGLQGRLHHGRRRRSARQRSSSSARDVHLIDAAERWPRATCRATTSSSPACAPTSAGRICARTTTGCCSTWRTAARCIVQYNKHEFNQAQYGPYPAKIGDRPGHRRERARSRCSCRTTRSSTRPTGSGPRPGPAGCRSAGPYFLGERDPRYVDLVRSHGSVSATTPAPKTGALVEARVGKGRWIYIGLGLWRQLPAGTDGAYRLMANLLSLGKR